jgi:hypothetical protein
MEPPPVGALPTPTYLKTPQMKYVANTRDQIKAARGFKKMSEAEAIAKLQWKALTAMREWSGSYLPSSHCFKNVLRIIENASTFSKIFKAVINVFFFLGPRPMRHGAASRRRPARRRPAEAGVREDAADDVRREHARAHQDDEGLQEDV